MLVTLDGVQMDVKAGVSWKYTRGVVPYVLVIETARTPAEALFEASERFGSVLVLEAEGKRLEVRGLTIVGLSPTSTPHTVKLSLADQRWTWPYVFVVRRYNVRRKTLHRRRISRGVGINNQPANLPVDVQRAIRVVADDVAYAAWSLTDAGEAFTGADVVRDVMERVVDPASPGFETTDNALTPELPDVEGLEVNAQGDTAVQRALGAMGGNLDVWVDARGVAIVYAVQDGTEFAEVGFTGSDRPRRAIVGRALSQVQDNSKIRPSRIDVLFERLIEGRVDFREGDDELATGTRTQGDRVVPIVAFNVFPMPEDGVIPGVGDRGSRRVLQGTWVTLADLLAFYNATPEGNSLAVTKPLSVLLIRRLWFSNALNAYAHPSFDKGGVWATRMAVIRQHYRATYRIERPWLDRYKKIEAFRVALEDPETGGRSPSPAFFDYTVLFAFPPSPGEDVPPASDSEKALTELRKAVVGSTRPPGTDIISTAINGMNQAPATVAVVDSDLGIIHIRMNSDFSSLTDRYLRSGTNALTKAFAFGAADGRRFLLQDEELSADHEVSIVLTFVMGAPNDDRRFFRVPVTPQEAAKFLVATATDEGEALGPVLTVRVGAPRAVARFAWDDTKAEDFYRFAAGRQGADGEDPNIGDPINLEQLTAYAQAVAAKEIARFRNHPEGSLVSAFAPGAAIRGTVSTVAHEFTQDADGGALTTVELLPEGPGLDVAATLPKDVRRVIEGFVDDNR